MKEPKNEESELAQAQYENRLLEHVARYHDDPEGFVYYIFPWGQGELSDSEGPREWQAKYLRDLGEALRAGDANEFSAILTSIASGHGIGKSAIVAWLILWAVSTQQDARCIVTAGTMPQLLTKTWPELSKWHRLALNSHWFIFTSTSLYSSDPEHAKTWRADAQTWSKERPEAFAGLHNKGKRLLMIFDEASQIPQVIWEVAEGSLTDERTEMIFAVFGNPTRNTGRFQECFGKQRHRWKIQAQIDSREVEGTNKQLFADWIEQWGEDSDFVRVRVRGRFPRASDLQFIPSDWVTDAQKREAVFNADDPLIMAIDMARGGMDNFVIRYRKGRDARSIAPVRIPGSECRDSMILVSKITDQVSIWKPDAIFIDATGIGGPAGDRLRQLGYRCFDVQFGGASPDPHYGNMRSFMYASGREWLRQGGAIPDDPILEQDLTNVEYCHNAKDQLLLEKKEDLKKRGLPSPDDADALMMTFAWRVAPRMAGKGQRPARPKQRHETRPTDYNPFGPERL